MPRPPYREGDIIGQRRVFSYVRKLVRGGMIKSRLVAILLFGPPGSGKTTIATLLAAETGGRLWLLVGSPELTPAVLCQTLREAQTGDMVFIDEAHACPASTQEVLYRYIDQQEIPVVLSSGRLDPSNRQRVARVNLLLATTWPGKILGPLHSRLEPVRLRPYSNDELKGIVAKEAADLSISLSPQAARTIAERCQGSPREAKQMTGVLSTALPELRCFTQTDVEGWLRERGISRHGVAQVQREYLVFLRDSPNRTSTIERLVACISGVDQGYVRKQVEPFLLSIGAIVIDRARLRVLTDVGAKMLGEIEEEDRDA